MRESERDMASTLPRLIVRFSDGGELRFTQPFHIGRDDSCELQVQDVHVSRRHAVVSPSPRGEWTIRDLQSSNGLLVDGVRVDSAKIGDGLSVVLGLDGPTLEIYPETAAPVRNPRDPQQPTTKESDLLEGYAERYFK